jgi:rod shape-determining protein MreC
MAGGSVRCVADFPKNKPMDWELYQRQRATLVFITVAFLSFLLLAFQRSSAVQNIKAFVVACTFPSQRLFSQLTSPSTVERAPSVPAPEAPALPDAPAVPAEPLDLHPEQSRALRVLSEENQRLSALLGLRRERWPQLVAARVVNRDPQRWFQEVLLDKGRDDGIQIDDPVIALMGSRQALVGRIVEAGANTSRVMLIYDSLSSVAATVSSRPVAPSTTTVEGRGIPVLEDGVVEGSNSHDLYLKYLPRDSKVQIGDLVVTSGLGKMFPAGVPLGWIEEVELDPRQLFLQARLRSALVASPLRVVGILVKRE